MVGAERHEPSFGDHELIIAVHEAGHAVACSVLGVPFSSVSIGAASQVLTEAHSWPDTKLEESGPGQGDGSPNQVLALGNYIRRCRNQVVICFSGRAAEEHATCQGMTAGIGVDSDLKDLRDARYFLREYFLAQEALNQQLESSGRAGRPVETRPGAMVEMMLALKAEAEDLVESHFRSISLVAQTLVAARQVTSGQVAQLLVAE